MNEVYLSEKGQLFIDGHKINNVREVSMKTNWTGTTITIEFKGKYKSEFINKVKEHSLDECFKE